MIFYLTFNDAPSGIYSSQVIDVLECLTTRSEVPVKLVAFISIRNYIKNRRTLRKQYRNAAILPMIPFLKNWRLNRYILYLLCLRYKPKAMIARGVFATNLAFFARSLNLTGNVCYDGRGAIAAEWEEYKLSDQQKLQNEIPELEENAVNKCDFSIAVSEQLIQYWRQTYQYKSEKYVVIPCTLNTHVFNKIITQQEVVEQKRLLGYAETDLLLIYSGSSAGWQSLNILKKILPALLISNPDTKILFLIQDETLIGELKIQFPDRVQCKWVDHNQVHDYLKIGDYGILIREKSITNKVSSPVKFAEYLASGLSVIISEELGDYTEFTKNNGSGYVLNNVDEFIKTKLYPVSAEQREKNKRLANLYFNKYSTVNLSKYEEIIRNL